MRFMTKSLELDTVLRAVTKYAKTTHVVSRLLALSPMTDSEQIKASLEEVESLRSLLVQAGQLPLIPDFDIHKLINYAAIERRYNIVEILHIRLFLVMEKDIINYYKNAQSLRINIGTCQTYFLDLNNHHALLANIENMIDPDGVIKDDASIELSQIRRKQSKLDKSLQDKLAKLVTAYSSYLSDQVVVMRNDRFCIGVKESHKNHIKGVIHDVSASGQTVYIEPEQTRQITAEIESLRVSEQKEIERIIDELSKAIQQEQQTLARNLDALIELDFIQAKANYAILINAVVPHVNDDGFINLKDARHPLLNQKEAVPISLQLDHHHKVLLITGPNTGGKTVALKTLGLLTLMMQVGLLLPVNPSTHIAVFEQVFADIGDEQSISQSLSTFSSHLKKIIGMTVDIKDNTLILLDEIGSGTDPNEGVSLAIAILNAFKKHDVRMMVTTHYSELKRYAYEQPDIQTASVAFDKESLKPLYHIHMGTTGSSHAFLIASRLGLSKSIIDEANELYKGRQTDLAKLMETLNDEMVAVSEEKIALEDLKLRVAKEEKYYQDARQALIEKQDRILQQVKDKEREKWEKKKEELVEILEELKQKQTLTQPVYAAYKNKLNQNVSDDQTHDDRKLHVGDQVFILPYQQYGNIKEISEDKYIVTFGQFELTFKRSDLRKDQEAKPKKTKPKINKKAIKEEEQPKRAASLELDLRGFRYDEVFPELDQAIDRAMLSGLATLRVIHGFGTGAVRKAVQAYIKQSPHISSSRFGKEGEGLNGVTILTLK